MPVPKGDYPPQYQPLFPKVVIAGDECLNLNVWAPYPKAAGLPVLVWIHGGSFMNGSGSVGEYDGSAFARDGVVCVTINYRLAAEGFLFWTTVSRTSAFSISSLLCAGFRTASGRSEVTQRESPSPASPPEP